MFFVGHPARNAATDFLIITTTIILIYFVITILLYVIPTPTTHVVLC